MDNAATSKTIIDVRQMLPRTRHPLIFDTFAGLKAEETLLVITNHEPWPLQYQFNVRHRDQFGWCYEEEGPDVWRVRINRKA